VESAFDPIPLDAVAARVYGEVALDLRRKGRKASSRAFGALIAACAIANGLSLYTANPSDFEGIERLDVVTVPHMG
jgi:predicted nucleic acid-binding protein